MKDDLVNVYRDMPILDRNIAKPAELFINTMTLDVIAYTNSSPVRVLPMT